MSIFASLDSPSFDINAFKTSQSAINSDVSDVLLESSNLTNVMSQIVVNSNKEIDKYKTILDINDDNINVTLNTIQWNYYYYKRFKKINEILRYYILICIVLILLSKLQSPYFDNMSYYFITGIIIAGLFIYVMYSLWDIYIRDNINFDEYDYNRYGTGISSSYDPMSGVDFVYTPPTTKYDTSGCLFYANSGSSVSSSSVLSASSSSMLYASSSSMLSASSSSLLSASSSSALSASSSS